ncbi:hypothetical protein GGI25_000037 [Coemansia spiralis]|uniref:Palmitoyl-protein thioesterase 1 n=2 Tax=Coemansia TaxID=4863 RepID=A0A9W8G8S9_9FUNG|nr:hypothetical protein GGI25_000037 [Coemansia spiralis]
MRFSLALKIFISFLASISYVCIALKGDSPTPVVIWHGMGDTCCDNNTMGWVASVIKSELPGAYVHSIRLASSESADRNAGFFGNLNTQINRVCNDLAEIEELKNGVNMMGFSQGGLFLRALIQRCPAIQAKTLVTYGSPHSGVSKIPECGSESDFMCNWMRQLASRGVYSWYIRDHVIQAQYFKDPVRIDQYLQYNIFLPDINGDLAETNKDYKERILALENMVLIRFDEDNLISPSTSSWFGFIDADGNEVPLRNTTLYSEDRLGLQELDKSGRLTFVSVEGKHMRIDEEILREMVSKYFVSSPSSSQRQRQVLKVQGEYPYFM